MTPKSEKHRPHIAALAYKTLLEVYEWMLHMGVKALNIMMQLLSNMKRIHLFFPISHTVTACLNNTTELQHHMVNANQPEIHLRAHSFSQWW